LDANALLIFFADRPGARRVDSLFREALRVHEALLMSAINWGEVVYSMWKEAGEREARSFIMDALHLPLIILPVDRERATQAAELKSRHALGYADSFAAALAIEQAAILVSADPEFQKLGKRLKILPLPRHKT
jgi:ribonuclease VapC